MQIHEWTDEDLALAEEMGAGGRIGDDAQAFSFGYRELGGEGLVVSLNMDGRDAEAWVAETAFCEWVSPLLAAPAYDAFPPDLTGALAAWALAPLAEFAEQCGAGAIAVKGIARGTCSIAFGSALTLSRDGWHLAIRPLGWDTETLRKFGAVMPPATVAAPIVVPVALVAGWAYLRQGQIDALAPGDAIVLDASANVKRGEAWMFQQRPLAKIVAYESAWRVESVMNQVEAEMMHFNGGLALPDELQELQDLREMQALQETRALDETRASLVPRGHPAVGRFDDVRFALTAEIASMTVPLDTLRNLAPGQMLDTGVTGEGRVSLKVNGLGIGTGRIIRVGERLLVRVD
ncbi:type III secretion protein Q [Paraburkholderia sp. Clong3]|uniref:type III secretion system cytoplasmic ring protein SctQ n=1 Tax=Paraburkholderia sp. Clong3 TaxID=2991061 RepID=UPI003D1AE4FB